MMRDVNTELLGIIKSLPQLKDQKDFDECCGKINEIRMWMIKNNISAWAFRKAMIYQLHIDTEGAIRQGVNPQILKNFDIECDRQSLEIRNRERSQGVKLGLH